MASQMLTWHEGVRIFLSRPGMERGVGDGFVEGTEALRTA
jgi:hypothetical protein